MRLYRRLLGHDPAYRRALNELQADIDRAGLRFASWALLILLILKTWLSEQLPGLAFFGSSHAVLAQGLALLIVKRRSFYVRHREWLLFLLMLNLTWVVYELGMHGGTIAMKHHGGSCGRLLLLICVSGSPLWVCVYSIHSQLALSFAQLALPLLTMIPLAGAKQVCERHMAGAPGVDDPLSRLHCGLTRIHLPASPATQLLLGEATESLQRCMVVSSWLTIMLAVLLPLSMLEPLERHTRRMLAAKAHRQAAQESAAQALSQWWPPPVVASDADAAGSSRRHAEEAQQRQQALDALHQLYVAEAVREQQWRQQREMAQDPSAMSVIFDLYLGSNVAWFCSSVLAAFLHNRGPG